MAYPLRRGRGGPTFGTQGQERAIDRIVDRPRIVERVADAQVVVIEAASGSGKSTVLRQLAAAHGGPVLLAELRERRASWSEVRADLHRAAWRHGLSDLATASVGVDGGGLATSLTRWTGPDAPALLLLDDVHHADEGLAVELLALLDAWPPPHRVVLAGRRVPARLRGGALSLGASLLDDDDLRFRIDEATALVGDVPAGTDPTELAADLTERYAGWAAAVALDARRWTGGPRPSTHAADRPAVVRELLDAMFADAPPGVIAALRGLAHLPRIDDTIVAAAGVPGGLGDLRDAGLPLVAVDAASPTTPIGAATEATTWWTLPDVIRDALVDRGEGADATGTAPLVRTAADRYHRDGDPTTAMTTLSATGLHRDVAELLVALPPAAVADLDVADLTRVVEAMPAAVLDAHPRVWVVLSDVATVSGRIELHQQAIDRAERRVPAVTDADTAEVRASVVARALVSGDRNAAAEADALLADPRTSPLAAGRITAARARAWAGVGHHGARDLHRAAAEFGDAVRAFLEARAPVHAWAAQVMLVTDVLLPLARPQEALDRIDTALAAARGSVASRVSLLPYRAFALIELGRYAEAEPTLRELRHGATGAGNRRAAAYARWAAARAASQRGDAAATVAACAAVDDVGFAAGTPDAVRFPADAALLLARVGRPDDAQTQLDRAQRAAAADEDPAPVLAELAVATYAGDGARVDAAVARLEHLPVPPRDAWRVALFHAHRHLADLDGGGRAEVGAAAVGAAFERAAQLGHPELPLIQEAALAGPLLEAASAVSTSARDVRAGQGCEVRVLGTLEVERDGVVTTPTGRVGELLAYVALHGGQVRADEVVDVLWPDADAPQRGRERLRTVLRRLRRDHGEVVERHGEVLRLTPSTRTDVAALRRDATRARAGGADRERAAAAAVAHHRGRPAPSLGAPEWLGPLERELEHELLAMHDVIVEVAAHDGRLDEAIRSASAALTIDPLAEPRALLAARMLAEQGRRPRALRVLDECRAALLAEGLEPSPELGQLEAYLRRGPRWDPVRAVGA